MNQISPLLPADLDEALALLVEEPATQARLRWHLRTPYALALKATENARIVGFALGTLHADHATVDDVFVYPTSMGEGIGSGLVRALLAHMEAQGAAHQGVVALPDSAGFWERMGFVVQGGLLRYSSGTFDSASREEVVPLEAPHLLAVQRLFQRAFGADRSQWLREHADFGSAYLEDTRVRGFALPLPGQGLIVAEEPAIGLELQRWLWPTHAALTLPVGNMAAHMHLTARRYTACEAGTRMVRGPVPDFRAGMVFAHP